MPSAEFAPTVVKVNVNFVFVLTDEEIRKVNFVHRLQCFIKESLCTIFLCTNYVQINLYCTTLWANSVDDNFDDIFLFLSSKQDLTFHTNRLYDGHEMSSPVSCYISKFGLLNFLLGVLCVNSVREICAVMFFEEILALKSSRRPRLAPVFSD